LPEKCFHLGGSPKTPTGLKRKGEGRGKKENGKKGRGAREEKKNGAPEQAQQNTRGLDREFPPSGFRPGEPFFYDSGGKKKHSRKTVLICCRGREDSRGGGRGPVTKEAPFRANPGCLGGRFLARQPRKFKDRGAGTPRAKKTPLLPVAMTLSARFAQGKIRGAPGWGLHKNKNRGKMVLFGRPE